MIKKSDNFISDYIILIFNMPFLQLYKLNYIKNQFQDSFILVQEKMIQPQRLIFGAHFTKSFFIWH